MNSRLPNATRLTRDQCRAVDRYAIDELGIPGIVLMENAGRNAALLIDEWVRDDPRQWISVVCGKGNNAGDGFVIARHLARLGHDVQLDLLFSPDSFSPDAGLNFAVVERMGVKAHRLDTASRLAEAAERWASSAAVVDAMLGTGFHGNLQEPIAGTARAINALDGPLIVAVDIPSGLDADTGLADGDAVRADRTITFIAKKQGYAADSARAFLGKVTVCDIGAPTELILNRLGISQ